MTINQYNKFDDIQDDTLRAWNRCAVAFNIFMDEKKNAPAIIKQYLNQFVGKDRDDISVMYKRITDEGYHEVKRKIINHVGSLPREDN